MSARRSRGWRSARRDALRDIYKALTPWQKVQVARHPDRPHCLDYVGGLFTEFTPLAGDRAFGEDHAIVCGFGRFRGEPIAVIGQEKGDDTKSRLKHNFGMAKPEGYRKAVRFMELADRFGVPVISLVDTAGAYPGVDAEERGQAEAIARSTSACLALKVPSLSVVIGEGGSGGAIAIATANRVYMLEHAIYSVISPEGAASILWHDSTRAKDAATNMKITAQDLLDLKIIDGIIAEPLGGAHRGAGSGDRGDRRPDRQGAVRACRVEHGFSRAAAREIPGHRPQSVSQRRPASLERGAFPPQKCRRLPSTICREGTCRALAVIKFQG